MGRARSPQLSDHARLAGADLGAAALAVVALFRCRVVSGGPPEAFFAIAVALLLGPDIAAALSAWRKPSAAPQAPRKGFATAVADRHRRRIHRGGAVASASNLTCVRMAADHSEPEVVAMVKERELQGRLVVWFDWGEYAIWHFAPQLLVSIDGRRETVYSDQVMQKHLNFYYVPSSSDAFLVETRPDYICLPADLPVVSTLLANGWMPMFRGPRSIWLSRDASMRCPVHHSWPERPALFPWPLR